MLGNPATRVKSRRAGERVMASVRRFVEGRLKLKVNEEGSAVDRPGKREFLGIPSEWASMISRSRKAYWRLANTPQVNKALGLAYWRNQGLLSLIEPTYAEPNVRWCGRMGAKRPLLPEHCTLRDSGSPCPATSENRCDALGVSSGSRTTPSPLQSGRQRPRTDWAPSSTGSASSSIRVAKERWEEPSQTPPP